MGEGEVGGDREKVLKIKIKKKEKTHEARSFREQVGFQMSAECH